jgi:hypothetical protein
VIGVNFAVFTENTASNFAVPIRYALALLLRANWKSPEADADKNNSSNTNQPAPANPTGVANASR